MQLQGHPQLGEIGLVESQAGGFFRGRLGLVRGNDGAEVGHGPAGSLIKGNRSIGTGHGGIDLAEKISQRLRRYIIVLLLGFVQFVFQGLERILRLGQSSLEKKCSTGDPDPHASSHDIIINAIAVKARVF